MAKRVRIRCINKTDRRSAHERIKNVGGLNSDGTRWKLSVKKTIRNLESREWEYYVEESGVTVEVIVATDGDTSTSRQQWTEFNRTISFRSLNFRDDCRSQIAGSAGETRRCSVALDQTLSLPRPRCR
nr:DUF3892 domain-containing protein [Bradyrhizobium sp. CCBAU 45321]